MMDVYHALAAFGIPTLLLLVFFFAGWRLTRWLAGNIAEPFVSKHISMMERLSAAFLNQTELLAKIAEQNEREERRHEDNVNRLEQILERMEGVCRYPGQRKTPTTLPAAVDTKG